MQIIDCTKEAPVSSVEHFREISRRKEQKRAAMAAAGFVVISSEIAYPAGTDLSYPCDSSGLRNLAGGF
jgi:hypothetical protein